MNATTPDTPFQGFHTRLNGKYSFLWDKTCCKSLFLECELIWVHECTICCHNTSSFMVQKYIIIRLSSLCFANDLIETYVFRYYFILKSAKTDNNIHRCLHTNRFNIFLLVVNNNIGLNLLPWTSFVSNLYFQLRYFKGLLKVYNWLFLWCLVPWINHLPPVSLSTFANSVLNDNPCMSLTCFLFIHIYIYILLIDLDTYTFFEIVFIYLILCAKS